MLEALERANLFVVPLDEERRWYRVHPLIREALQARLQTVEPERVPLLHRRAAAWHAGQQHYEEAIPHALAAQDFVSAAELIERFLVPQSWRNEYHTLRRWLGHLPEEVLRARPDLSLLYAQAITLTSPPMPNRLPLVEAPLRFAEQGYRDGSDEAGVGSVLTARAVLLLLQGDFADAFALAEQALPLLPTQNRQWRGLCLNVLATQALLSGQIAHAGSLLKQALALYEQTSMLPGRQFATALLGDVALSAGDLELAAHAFRQALDISTEQPDLARIQLTDEGGGRRAHFERLAWYGLASLAYARNELEEAQQYLQQALAEGPFLWMHVLTPGLLLQVRLLYAQGEAERARALLVEFAAGVVQPEGKREVHLCQAWLALKMGDLEVAQRWEKGLTEADAPLSHVRREEEALLRARLRIVEGRPEIALLLLEPLMREARDAGRLHAELQILVLEALAWEARSNRAQACQCLLQAVTRASREGYQRLFLEEGQPMKYLLKTLLPDLREQRLLSYVHRLLQAFVSAPARAVPSPGEEAPRRLSLLTPQEQRVLRLLAEGASNQDIANALVISLATARKHVSHILAKLGAENRTQAIARAREYTLL